MSKTTDAIVLCARRCAVLLVPGTHELLYQSRHCAGQVTDDITAYSSADLFSAVGKTTNVIVRFSLVTGLPGSPEWLRDPRGFAVKFYTQQGNWDLVGNNLPVRCLPVHGRPLLSSQPPSGSPD